MSGRGEKENSYDPEEGLMEKFTVWHNGTGNQVEATTFVLLPESDPLAAAAMLFYADLMSMMTRNESPLLAEVELLLQSVDNLDGPGHMYEAASKLYNRLLDDLCGK